MIIDSPLATLSFAFSVTAPIFVMLVLGIILKRKAMITDNFIKIASQLVYNIGLPVMLFTTCATAHFGEMADRNVLIAFSAMTAIVFAGSLLTAHWHCEDPRDQGVFIQGAFRGNLVILGLAFCANAYGEHGLAIAALPVAMTVVFYNVLSVYVLNRSLHPANSSLKPTLIGIAKNPLIIAIFLGLIINAVALPLPKVLLDSGKYLSQMVLPLALICIGGALDISRFRTLDSATLSATAWKLFLSPIIACAIAIVLGVRGESLAILFLLAASPTATISFVMVQAMNGNTKLAANIIVQTTLGSMLTVTAGLWFLQAAGLM
ncbi:transporter [Cellvibrio zantedeschiae]|uniref:Transporter n=1 Tax=Cellvibrio zantedeschiae TaxID=1237077 RepID=A0ABQ3AUD0_9GAMM|nr:AEC family transporter [Cellvibrio zantedeschiae]GGY67498.1 transporter [Cellvibrio zantedeschiae]